MLLELFKFIHYAGLILGVGGATFASIIMAKAGKDADIGKATGKLMPYFIKAIWLGILFLIISGVYLQLNSPWKINTSLLIIKHILVVWIIIFGIFLGIKSKKIIREKDESKKAGIGRQIKIVSKLNLLLWWLVTLMSAFL